MADPFLFMLTLMIAVILSLFPAGAPLAATVYPSWIGESGTGGPGNWNVASNWTNTSVPPDNTATDEFRVTVSGPTSVVTLNNLDPAVDNLILNSGAQLLINARNLEIEDNSGGLLESTIANNGLIHLQGTTGGSRLVIDGVVKYTGSGRILFDSNIFHGIEGGSADPQQLFIDTGTYMLLEGSGSGGKGTLGVGLQLKNLGNLKITNFTELDLNASTAIPWLNRGAIIVEDDSTVDLTGDVDQSRETEYGTEGTLLVSGTLNLQNAHITQGGIAGTGQVNAAGTALDNVSLAVPLSCSGSNTIGGTIIFPSISFVTGGGLWVSGSTKVYGSANWYFPSDGSLLTILPSGTTASLNLMYSHYFFNGKVSFGNSTGSLSFNMDQGSEISIGNAAEFYLKPGVSTIAGKILTRTGGSATFSGATVTGEIFAQNGSTLALESCQATGPISTEGTGRVTFYASNLQGPGGLAEISGDIGVLSGLNLTGDIQGIFCAHLNAANLVFGSSEAHLRACAQIN